MQAPYQAVSALPPYNGGAYPYGNGAAPGPYLGGGQQPPAHQMPPQQNPVGMMGQNNAPGMNDTLQQQLHILSALKAQGVPQEQWPALLSVLMNNTAAQAAMTSGGLPAPSNAGPGQDDPRNRNGYEQMRSPAGRRDRSRSRSPNRWDRRRDESPPRGARRRDSPVYGEYSGNRNGDRGGDFDRRGGRGGGRGNYRQRSPQRRRSPSPQRDSQRDPQLPLPGPKWIEHDPSLPKGSIKGALRCHSLSLGRRSTHA